MSKISDKDKKDWDNFISNKENLPDKDKDLVINKIKKTKTFDLHGYSLNQANKEINNLVYKSFNQGLNKLIIVTGKGLHSENEKDPYVSKDLRILKYSVPDYLKNFPSPAYLYLVFLCLFFCHLGNFPNLFYLCLRFYLSIKLRYQLIAN